MLGEVVDGDQVEDQIDQHQHQDGDVEENHPLNPHFLNKARGHPHIRLHIWPIRKNDIQTKDSSGEEGSKTPSYQGETEEFGELRTFPGDFGAAEGPAEIQADDRHPSKHGDTYKVTKVAKDDTEDRAGQVNIVDNEDIGGDKEDAGDIANNNLAMEIEKVRNRDIDNEGDDEEDKTDNTEGSEEHVVLPVVPGTLLLLLLLTLEHHDVHDGVHGVPGPGLHTIPAGVSVSMMVQLAIPPDRVFLTRVQQVEGAAVWDRGRHVEGQEVVGGGAGHGQGEGEVGQQLGEVATLEKDG